MIDMQIFKRHATPTRASGFTLIELMIAVAIVGILAAIAYPSYVDKIRKARRTDAKSLVLQAANRSEQLYPANSNEYPDSMSQLGLPTQTDNGFYSVQISHPDSDRQRYQITATAIGEQEKDLCRRFSIDNTGRRQAFAADSTDATHQCW